jgi:hypothetical protein
MRHCALVAMSGIMTPASTEARLHKMQIVDDQAVIVSAPVIGN